jgi:hypothetical protein
MRQPLFFFALWGCDGGSLRIVEGLAATNSNDVGEGWGEEEEEEEERRTATRHSVTRILFLFALNLICLSLMLVLQLLRGPHAVRMHT